MAALYNDFTGQGNDGNPNVSESMLVDTTGINNSYGVHNSSIAGAGSSNFDGIKIRSTTLLGAGDNLGQAFAQILKFT